MAPEINTVTVTIQGRDYQIGCQPAEEEALRKSARYLDQQMTKIRARGNTLAFEKLAVMTALNISHDLLSVYQQAASTESDAIKVIRQLESKIDELLENNRQLDFGA
jgi:cell division protein ZapA